VNVISLARRRVKAGALLVDPPWHFETYSEDGEGRAPQAHYDTMSFADIKALPVGDMALDDSVLFLWVPDTHLPQAFDLIASWGFVYKTIAFHWVKLNKKPRDLADFFVGMGYWTRANPELCLLATRGSPERQSASVRRLIVSPLREHSRKPDEVRDRIVELVPGPYLELFARSGAPGWISLGDQAELFDAEGNPITRRIPSAPIRRPPKGLFV